MTEAVNPEKQKAIGAKAVLIPVAAIVAIIIAVGVWVRSAERKAHEVAIAEGAPNLSVGGEFPDIALKDGEGATANLSTVLKKVNLINVWATWCAPCVQEMPSIVKLYGEYGAKGLEVISLNVDENPEEVLAPFRERMGMLFPVFIDPAGELSDKLGIEALPLTFVVDSKRKILAVERGEMNWNSSGFRTQVDGWLKP